MRKIDLNNFRVARSDTARDINRRIVLNLVRKHQPVSRASLARHSGLQRSTVSSITEQLIAEQWLTESAMGQLPRGRKPTFLNLNGKRGVVIGVAVRPGVTSLGLADLESNLIFQDSMPTPRNPVEFVDRLTQRVCDLIKANPQTTYFEGIGISLPGRIDATTHKLIFAPNINWNGMDLKTPLEQATGLPVELENAANACALAEFWHGQYADGARNLIAVTVSEGIGVGIILNGQLIHGSAGVAGEFGHVAINPEGPLCRCGNRGCWEILASDTAACHYYSNNGTPGKPKAAADGATVSFADLLNLVQQGDPKAGAALDLMAHHLGVGMSMLVSGLAPDIIVVVGEVTRAWERVGPIINQVVQSRSFTHAGTNIVPTDFSAQPRLRGPIALVLQKHFSAPAIA